MEIASYPRCRLLGHSVEGRPIEAFAFGPELSAGQRLDTLFIGVFHGDEGISGQLLNRFTGWLTDNPPSELAARSVMIIPVLNPDGLHRGQRMNARMVDLNRNYPTPDWKVENDGTPYYSGPEAGSEPETQIIIDLLARYQPKKIVSVHSPYKVLNFDGPARELAEAMAAHSGYEVVESIGYPTPGSFGTYAGKERNVPVITLELPPGSDDPPHHDQELPVETLDQVWQANRDALIAAIRF